MNIFTIEVILAVITSGLALYVLQYVFPSLSLKSESERMEAETERINQQMVMNISAQYRTLAEECAMREHELAGTLADTRAQLALMDSERQDLLSALRASNRMVDDLRSQLDLEQRSTKAFPYLDLVADLYVMAESDELYSVTQKINDFAQKRPNLREAIKNTSVK